MITQIFAIPINPQPWKVPPAAAARSGSRVFVKFGQDQGGAAFKEALKESIVAQGAFMMDPGYSLDIFTWRRREQYKDKANRTRTKNRVDATNMQKLIEDALTGTCFHDDVDNIAPRLIQVEQGIDVIPRIVLIVRGELNMVNGGVGNENFLRSVPADVRIETESKYSAMMREIESGTQAGTTGVNNAW